MLRQSLFQQAGLFNDIGGMLIGEEGLVGLGIQPPAFPLQVEAHRLEQAWVLSRQTVQWHQSLLREQCSRGIIRPEDIRRFPVGERLAGHGEEFISSTRGTNSLRQRIRAGRNHRDAGRFTCLEQSEERLREGILSLESRQTIKDEKASTPYGLHD